MLANTVVAALMLCANTGLVEVYAELASTASSVDHPRLANKLNRKIPRIINDFEANSIGFYVAPSGKTRKLLENRTDGEMQGRQACFSKEGELLSTGEWFPLEPGDKTDLDCDDEGSWTFVEWASDEPAPNAVTEEKR